MSQERTISIIKPDAVAKNVIGEIYSRFEKTGLKQVLEGKNAIAINREVMGAANPAEAAAGTIRADFATSIDENAVHGSDGPDTAKAGMAFFFSDDELCPRLR